LPNFLISQKIIIIINSRVNAILPILATCSKNLELPRFHTKHNACT
jgi:hypothetical protein